MSAPEFRALFNNPNFKYWFDKTLSNKKHPYSSFVHQTRESSKKLIANSIVDFVLTKDTLETLVGSQRASTIFKEVKDNNLNYLELAEYRNIDGQEQIVLPELKFSTLNESVEKLLNDIGSNAGTSNIGTQAGIKVAERGLHKGHVFGFGNTLINLTKEDIRKAGVTSSEAELKALDEFIDALIGVLEEYDITTSDIKGLDLEINAKYRKTSSNWLIEWQGSAENQESGSRVNRVLGKTGASTYTGARGVFTAAAQKNSGKILDDVVKNFVNNFVKEGVSASNSSALNLLNIKSSPSMKDMIIDTILSIVSDDHKQKYSKSYSGAIDLPKIPLITVKPLDKSNLVTTVNRLKTSKQKIAKAITKVRNTRTPLIDLEAILRARINKQVMDNMGQGSDTRVLNYRSGRFSSSVEIDRLSESRQGLISVFYKYMKNPYATFSEGGRQEFPRSRDPKALISKSIREIAAPIVGNRLRAIVV